MTWEQQSPINICPTVTTQMPEDYLIYQWDDEPVLGKPHYDQHGVMVSFHHTGAKLLLLERKEYVFRQMHFHHPSEHFINGQNFDAELHLVHQNLTDCTFAVVAVMLSKDQSLEKDKNFNKVVTAFQRGTKQNEVPADLGCWLPNQRTRLYRYEGSLTTDPYTENVSWIIEATEKKIPPKLFDAIFQGSTHTTTARPIQPVNRRYILELHRGTQAIPTKPKKRK